jgi:hypothetical protein
LGGDCRWFGWYFGCVVGEARRESDESVGAARKTRSKVPDRRLFRDDFVIFV